LCPGEPGVLLIDPDKMTPAPTIARQDEERHTPRRSTSHGNGTSLHILVLTVLLPHFARGGSKTGQPSPMRFL
jgi:hypothetical protein